MSDSRLDCAIDEALRRLVQREPSAKFDAHLRACLSGCGTPIAPRRRVGHLLLATAATIMLIATLSGLVNRGGIDRLVRRWTPARAGTRVESHASEPAPVVRSVEQQGPQAALTRSAGAFQRRRMPQRARIASNPRLAAMTRSDLVRDPASDATLAGAPSALTLDPLAPPHAVVIAPLGESPDVKIEGISIDALQIAPLRLETFDERDRIDR